MTLLDEISAGFWPTAARESVGRGRIELAVHRTEPHLGGSVFRGLRALGRAVALGVIVGADAFCHRYGDVVLSRGYQVKTA
jgi:hypothetical protein